MKPTTDNLRDLEQQHVEALIRAESHPAGSKERSDAYREADRIASLISDWYERANPTPVA